jgi:hypothetical protein
MGNGLTRRGRSAERSPTSSSSRRMTNPPTTTDPLRKTSSAPLLRQRTMTATPVGTQIMDDLLATRRAAVGRRAVRNLRGRPHGRSPQRPGSSQSEVALGQRGPKRVRTSFKRRPHPTRLPQSHCCGANVLRVRDVLRRSRQCMPTVIPRREAVLVGSTHGQVAQSAACGVL